MKNDYDNQNPDEKIFLAIQLGYVPYDQVCIAFLHRTGNISIFGDKEYSNEALPSLLLNRKECLEIKDFLEEILKNE